MIFSFLFLYYCKSLETRHIYKASLDRQAKWGLKWGTYPFLLLMLVASSLFFIDPGNKYKMYAGKVFSLLIFIAVLLNCLTRNIRAYILTNDKLIIKRVLKESDVEIMLSDIQKVERFPEEEFVKSRRISNFSIFGYFGDFHHPTFAYYKMYATNLSNLIMIEMKNNKKIVISPDDLELLNLLKRFVPSR